MKELEPSRQALLARVQRVRARMNVEETSGVSADDKAAFLAACCKYEQELSHLVYNVLHKVLDTSKNWEKWSDWNNWNDWHNWHNWR